MSTPTAPRQQDGLRSPTWASVSASLILPFDLRLSGREGAGAGEAAGWRTDRWTLKGLQDHSSYFAASGSPTIKDRARWFSSPRFRKALDEAEYSHLPASHAGNEALAKIGVVVKCIERRRYDEIGFLVIHVVLHGDALADPEAVFRALRRPYSPIDGPGAAASFPATVRTGLEEIIALSGLTEPPGTRSGARVGISKGGFIALVNEQGFAVAGDDDGDRRKSIRPFLVTHLAPEQEVAAHPPAAARLDKWGAVEAWAFALSSGIGAGRSLTSEPNTAEAAQRCSGWLDHTFVRASENGVAFVSTDAADSKSRENSDIEALSHGPVVDLAVLALRQRGHLYTHAEKLAAVAATWARTLPDGRPVSADVVRERAEGVLREALVLDAMFVQFRNTMWFASVPGRPEGTSVLRLVQSGLGTDEMIAEIVEKQADLTRVLDLVAAIREREAQERRAEEALRRDKLNLVFGVGAAILAPSALVFGAAALLSEPASSLFGISLAVAVVLSAVFTLLVYRSPRINWRKRKGARRPAHATTDPQQPGAADT